MSGSSTAELGARLAEASRFCDLAAIETLLRSGPAAVPAKTRLIAAGLRAAAAAGECEAVELLLGHDRAAASAAFADERGRTALHLAAQSGARRAPDIARHTHTANRRV